MEYFKIVNPETNRRVRLDSRIGRRVIKHYLRQSQQFGGGGDDDDSNTAEAEKPSAKTKKTKTTKKSNDKGTSVSATDIYGDKLAEIPKKSDDAIQAIFERITDKGKNIPKDGKHSLDEQIYTEYLDDLPVESKIHYYRSDPTAKGQPNHYLIRELENDECRFENPATKELQDCKFMDLIPTENCSMIDLDKNATIDHMCSDVERIVGIEQNAFIFSPGEMEELDGKAWMKHLEKGIIVLEKNDRKFQDYMKVLLDREKNPKKLTDKQWTAIKSATDVGESYYSSR